MTVTRTKPISLEELWEYEAQHPLVFAAPRALAEARLIAAIGQPKRARLSRPPRRKDTPRKSIASV